MWSQMLFSGLPFRPLVGASISQPWLPPNPQTQSVWLPAGQQSLAFNLKIFRLDPITQPYCVMCLWVDHVPLYLSLSAVAFSTPFMASATPAYGQPASWWPASMSGMASVARSENGPRHVLLANEPKSISIIVPHYLSTMNPYSDLTM